MTAAAYRIESIDNPRPDIFDRRAAARAADLRNRNIPRQADILSVQELGVLYLAEVARVQEEADAWYARRPDNA